MTTLYLTNTTVNTVTEHHLDYTAYLIELLKLKTILNNIQRIDPPNGMFISNGEVISDPFPNEVDRTIIFSSGNVETLVRGWKSLDQAQTFTTQINELNSEYFRVSLAGTIDVSL